MACAHIVNTKTTLAFNSFQCSNMASGQVANVNVVPYTRSVMRRIIVTKYAKFLTLTYGYLGNVGHQIIGNSVRILTYTSAWMCSNGVEVTKQNYVPLRICFLNIH